MVRGERLALAQPAFDGTLVVARLSKLQPVMLVVALGSGAMELIAPFVRRRTALKARPDELGDAMRHGA